ncbi:anti-sigma factor antagonist [Streptomyces sp. NPDC047821]|uniref:anti-sigma factor antagonist n=1 Tax=unclassified Streptomyces TaxID=2593676 RepID=UPI00363BEDB3
MLFPCHRPSADQLVVEIHDVIDCYDEERARRDLCVLIARSGAHTVIIDVRTPLVTAGMVRVLLRVRQEALGRDTAISVVARRPLARKVFRVCGVDRHLRVTATLSGARALTRRCARRPAGQGRNSGKPG